MSIATGEVPVSGGKKRIGILCLSAIPDDPRVRRQGDVLTAAGFEVVAIGLPGHNSPDPEWQCLAVDDAARSTATLTTQAPHAGNWFRPRRLTLRLRSKVTAAIALLQMRINPTTGYWRVNPSIPKLYALASSHAVDIWLANDWTTLPIAARLAAEQNVPFGYDTHELAVEEYAHSFKWRLLWRPIVRAAEGGAIGDAAFVTCVSEGIADRLVQNYGLRTRPTVIRNTPFYRAVSPRPVGNVVRVLYHGLVAPGRGLEASIRSVALWQPHFNLTIRGPGPAQYKAELQALARDMGVSDRIVFSPPVPMTDLVDKAAEYDIGLFALADHSHQNVYVLPNKFFEYTMAGLALCLSDLPEMAVLLRKYDLGVLIASMSPAAIAKAINSFDNASLERFKRNAIDAARTLCWDTEGEKLVAICRAAIAGPVGAASLGVG